MALTRIDPRTRDITDEFGGILPYPGYGGDIALPPTTVAEAKPTIGVPTEDWRRQHGLGGPPPPEQPGIDTSGHYDQEYPELTAAENRQSADQAAATLAPNAFQFTEDPWGVDVSQAQMAQDFRAHAGINARHGQRMAEIARSERDPMQEELEARKTTAALEELTPAERPLIGEAGAFTQDPTTQGTIRNNAPAERVGDLRARQAASAKTIMGSAAMRQLTEELERIERGTSLDQEGREAPLQQPMSEEQKESARQDAFKRTMLSLQMLAGGKDYSGFVRPTYDPNAALAALAAPKE